jgi:hypothetical protein
MTDQSARHSYELIGRATVAWNDVELLWMTLFLTFLDAPRAQADATYHSLRAFAAQRDMTVSLGRSRLNGIPALDALDRRLGQLSAATGKAAGDRNAIAHAKFLKGSDDGSLGVWQVGDNRLIGVDLNAAIVAMIEDFTALAEDLETFLFQVCTALEKEPPSFETP